MKLIVSVGNSVNALCVFFINIFLKLDMLTYYYDVSLLKKIVKFINFSSVDPHPGAPKTTTSRS